MAVSDVLAPFVGALNLEKLRVGPPRRFIFFCGGQILDLRRPPSLRAYLKLRIDNRSGLENASFVYAESATALFRDSKFKDLIQFEAEIAQISEIVLLIAESPGSLTELGAFSMHPEISPRLQVFVRDDFFGVESFIRNGPLRHLEEDHPGSVLYYPWRGYKDGRLKITSISGHISRIRTDINERLRRGPKSEEFNSSNVRHIMITIFWCIFVLRGASLKEITDCIRLFGVDKNQSEVMKYLYCMRVAGWVGDKQYWPAPGSEDAELGVLMEPEVGHGEAEVYTRVQA